MKLWAQILSFLCTSTYFINLINAQPYDQILKQNVDHTFISVGFTYIDDSKWFTITTIANEFVKDTILLVSIPQVGGTFPVVPKMRQPTTLNADKTVTFSVKLVQPNDSFCSKQWYVPQYLSPVFIAYMVFELGSYTVNGFQFIAGKGTLTRASAATSATFTNGNLIAIWFPTGCVSSTEFCLLNVAAAADRGAINLLQTDNNVKEVGKTLYLSVRSRTIDQRRGQWVLVPHDAAASAPDYHVLTAETLGYLAYRNGIRIECLEKMVWETAYKDNVNFVPNTITYRNTYDYPPGLFGMVGTITSLCNTILKSANWSPTSATFSINEDQCVTEEFQHITPETVYLVVVGEKKLTNSTYRCYVNFNTALTPTPNPTMYPTNRPTTLPTFIPSANPTRAPTLTPSLIPSRSPTFNPSSNPTFTPSTNPTFRPSTNPTFNPSSNPTFTPSSNPTFRPSTNPTFNPSSNPTFTPSSNPTFRPSSNPTFSPSFSPSRSPSFAPSSSPSLAPTRGTTAAPTNICSNSFPIEMYRE